MKDDRIYLRHILDCIRRVEEDTAGGKDAFLSSHTLQDAVLRNLQTMTESTQRLSESKKNITPRSNGVRSPLFAMCSFMTIWASTWNELGKSRNTMCRP